MLNNRKPGLLAIDIGTSSIRVTICTKNEGIKGRYVLKHEVNSRFSIDALWEKVAGLIRDAMNSCSDTQIEAIGICAFLGWVAIDENGSPVDQAWSWNESGDANEVKHYAARLSEETPYWIGRAINEELGVFKWGGVLRANGKKTTILSVKDYFNYRLTGVLKMDRAHASYTGLFSIQDREWDERLIDCFDLPKSSIPPLGEGCERVGIVLDEVAVELGLSENVTVALSGPDGTMAILGGGGWGIGKTIEVMGTTDVFFYVTEYIEDETLVSSGLIQNCHVVPGLYVVGGPTGVTGGMMSWLMKQLNWTFESDELKQMLEKWDNLTPAADGLYVVPSLTGSRVPDWNPLIRGTIVGLQPSHTKAELFKATVEGVAFGTRRIVERLENYVDSISDIIAIGGGSREVNFLQTRSNVLGRPIIRLQEPEASTIGVLALTGVLVGWYANVGDAVNKLNPVAGKILPQRRAQSIYEDLYNEYERLCQWTEKWYRAL